MSAGRKRNSHKFELLIVTLCFRIFEFTNVKKRQLEQNDGNNVIWRHISLTLVSCRILLWRWSQLLIFEIHTFQTIWVFDCLPNGYGHPKRNSNCPSFRFAIVCLSETISCLMNPFPFDIHIRNDVSSEHRTNIITYNCSAASLTLVIITESAAG